jgi:hypothetical protein
LTRPGPRTREIESEKPAPPPGGPGTKPGKKGIGFHPPFQCKKQPGEAMRKRMNPKRESGGGWLDFFKSRLNAPGKNCRIKTDNNASSGKKSPFTPKDFPNSTVH